MSRSGIYGDTRLCTGIFGEADLRPGAAAEPVLEAHSAASANFRGIRSAFPSDLNETFLAGYALLGKHGLSYDNYSPDFHRLPTLARLAQAHPEVPVIVNHLGGRIDPDAPAVSVCTALEQRRNGQLLRVRAAASDARFRPGTPPSGQATAGLLLNGSSGRMVAGLNRTDAATE